MAKRKAAPGTGAIRKRKNGLWEVMHYIGRNPKTGKRRYKSFYARRLADAIKKRDEWLRKKNRIESGQYTVAEWMQLYFDENKGDWKPATRDNYQWVLKKIIEAIGDMDIAMVKPRDLQKFLTELKEAGRSQSCISKVKSYMLQAFTAAEANSIIERNPVLLLKRMRNTKKPKQKEVFSLEEVRQILRKAPHTRAGLSCVLLLIAGLRKQEVLPLTKADIAPDGSWIRINKAVSRDHGRAYISDTKTYSGNRTIPIPQKLRHYIILLRDQCTGVYLWESPRKKGCVCNPSFFDDQYRAVLSEIGVRYLPPHNCRHTYITLMVTSVKNVDIRTIQSLAGHARLEHSLHYTHTREENMQHAAEEYADLLIGQEDT